MYGLDHLYTEQENSFIGHYSNGDMLSTINTHKKGEGEVCGIGPELCNSLHEWFYWCQVLRTKFNICLSISLKGERENTKILQWEEDFCMTSFRAAITDLRLVLCQGGENTDVCVSCGEKEREKIEREKRMEERV